MWLALCLVPWQAAASPSPVLCITLSGWAMNKQPSKESLKDKVKGIFGLGTQRPPNKQSDTKPSEFIITADIIKVCRSDWVSVHVHWMSPILFPAYLPLFDVFFCFGVFQELHPDCGLSNRVRTMNHICELAKMKKFEEVSLLTAVHFCRCLVNSTQSSLFVKIWVYMLFSMQWRLYGKMWKTCWLQSSHQRPDMLSCSCSGPLYRGRYKNTTYTQTHAKSFCMFFVFKKKSFCVKGERLGPLRAYFFKVIRDYQPCNEDLSDRLEVFKALTENGKDITYLEEDIGKNRLILFLYQLQYLCLCI